MVRIFREFRFEAAHQLEEYNGACANVHGHSYKLIVGLVGRTETSRGPDEGFLMDFSVLKKKVREIFLDDWDHSFLARGDEKILKVLVETGSKVIKLGFRPTAENMCRHILWQLHKNGLPVESIKLYETETSSAEARISDLVRAGGSGTDSVDVLQEIDMLQKLNVSEIFGPTIQGEGDSIGRKALFLRMYGCDDACTWCDTEYTWDGSERPRPMTIFEIVQKLRELSDSCGCKHVVLTGGNPCIHGGAMGDLLTVIKGEGYSIALETQGTVIPLWLDMPDSVVLSPKPPSSGNVTEIELIEKFTDNLDRRGTPYIIKVVVFDDADYNYFKKLYATFAPGRSIFYIQPGNPGGEFDLTASIKQYEMLVKKTVEDSELSDVRVLPQLHTWLWGNAREV